MGTRFWFGGAATRRAMLSDEGLGGSAGGQSQLRPPDEFENLLHPVFQEDERTPRA